MFKGGKFFRPLVLFLSLLYSGCIIQGKIYHEKIFAQSILKEDAVRSLESMMSCLPPDLVQTYGLRKPFSSEYKIQQINGFNKENSISIGLNGVLERLNWDKNFSKEYNYFLINGKINLGEISENIDFEFFSQKGGQHKTMIIIPTLSDMGIKEKPELLRKILEKYFIGYFLDKKWNIIIQHHLPLMDSKNINLQEMPLEPFNNNKALANWISERGFGKLIDYYIHSAEFIKNFLRDSNKVKSDEIATLGLSYGAIMQMMSFGSLNQYFSSYNDGKINTFPITNYVFGGGDIVKSIETTELEDFIVLKKTLMKNLSLKREEDLSNYLRDFLIDYEKYVGENTHVFYTGIQFPDNSVSKNAQDYQMKKLSNKVGISFLDGYLYWVLWPKGYNGAHSGSLVNFILREDPLNPINWAFRDPLLFEFIESHFNRQHKK